MTNSLALGFGNLAITVMLMMLHFQDLMLHSKSPILADDRLGASSEV